jgi:hypothetical protein
MAERLPVPTSAGVVVGSPQRTRFLAGALRREAGLCLLERSQPASSRRFRPLAPLSRCGCSAPKPCSARSPFPMLRIASVSRAIVRPGEYVSDVTSSSSAAALTLAPLRTSARVVATPTPSSCRSRGARARVHSRSFARSSALQIRIRSRHVATFWVSDSFEILSSTWKWIAFPRDPTGALSSRRHSCSEIPAS